MHVQASEPGPYRGAASHPAVAELPDKTRSLPGGEQEGDQEDEQEEGEEGQEAGQEGSQEGGVD